MKISEIITDKYKLRIPPTVYYDLLADVQEVEDEQEPKFIVKSDGTIEQIKNCNDCLFKNEWEKIGKLLSVVLEKQTEQGPTTKNDLEVDAISRQQAIERLKLNFPISDRADNSRDRHRYMQAMADIQAIRELPTVTPQTRKGHWIENKCTNCGYEVQPWNTTNYCPNCGAFCGGDNNG